MNPVDRMQFMRGVFHSYISSEPLMPERKTAIEHWILGDQNEEQAGQLLGTFRSAQSSKRFQFPMGSTRREELMNRIFKTVFENISEMQIHTIENTLGISTCSPWKQVVFIRIPNAISSFINITRFPCSAYIGCRSYFVGASIVQFTALYLDEMLPVIVNNTPISITSLFKSSVNIFKRIYSKITWTNIIAIYLLDFAIGSKIRAIPYLETIWKISMSITKTIGMAILFTSWQSTTLFLVLNSLQISIFTRGVFKEIELFFRNYAERANIERKLSAKQVAYQCWMQPPQLA